MGYSIDRTKPHVLPDFFKGLILRWSSLSNNSSAPMSPEDQDPRKVVTDPEDATIVTSQATEYLRWNMHKVILDVDLGVDVIPSSTPGHFHLVFDQYLPWEDYKNLLMALSDAGILEPGYVSASIDRGYTSLRLPWIKKA